ncbi:unnamed protein product [Citrullus colocynthis]|uniref:Uncharacterized protein n=1 Tax=Citrullus colocynthis TaxID=252529 RepID=A0ABP0Z5U2_9ROSI
MEPAANPKKQLCKYLKPGALAQMRDSRIRAKRKRDKSVNQIYLCRTSALESSPVSGTAAQSEIKIVEDFSVGPPLCLNRKKIAAIRPTNWFPNPNLEIPTTDLTRDRPVIDALSSDVAAPQV